MAKFSKSQTFLVDEVERSTKLLKRSTQKEVFEKRVKISCEAIFQTPRNISDVAGIIMNGCLSNAFVAAVHVAYSEHYPLVLTPDIIWMCIAQGFASHVNCNAEKLRHFFVQHEGKNTLEVSRDDFVKGSSANPWPEVFDSFSSQIRKAVGEKVHGALTPTFTTTGPVEKAAAQLVIMDAFKEYFRYLYGTCCGIPEITLEGTVEDWIALKEKATALGEYDLSWWTDELSPLLDQFVEAASGRVDQTFWSSIYKISGGSGGPFISGWIVTLFPYLSENIRNSKLRGEWRKSSTDEEWCFNCLTSNQFPPGLCSTPFTWDYYHTTYPMTFYSGFMAVSQDPNTLAIRPEIGWAVADQVNKDTSNSSQK